ncbi:MAG: 30S ribosomal protein S4e [Nanoarchaeota archaeon]|nr:30S ribosomal protein S4e [Nanoarchaeota archaeon]
MPKKHLKRIAAPRTWPIKRKGIKFVARPLPGKHKLNLGMPINVVFSEILKITKTTKETEKILYHKEILVDGRKIKDKKALVGLMDVISIPLTKEYYRLIINEHGWISSTPIDVKESKLKICKIMGKRKVKGKIQFNLDDGRNILSEENAYKVGDSLLITLPEQKIEAHLKFEKGAAVYMIAGKRIGTLGTISEIKEKSLLCKNSEDEQFETVKNHVLIVGKDKPVIKVK